MSIVLIAVPPCDRRYARLPFATSGLGLEFGAARSGHAPIGDRPIRWDDSGMHRRGIALAICALGVALGVVSLGVARGDPGYSLVGRSTTSAVALLAAGWALVGCGLAFWLRRPDSRFGPLLVLAGFAWFAPELSNPEVGSALAFTAGLALAAACPALVGHAVLSYPSGRLGSRLERAVVALAYTSTVLVLGVLATFFADPRAHGCNPCPPNLVRIADRGSVTDDLTRAGLYAGVAAVLTLAALCVRRTLRAAAPTRLVAAAGAVYLVLAAAELVVYLEHGFLSTGTVERRLWLGQAAALVGVAIAVVWAWVRARRARSAVAQLVVDLAQSPAPGGLRQVLAEIVGDPALVLAYPAGESERLVDAEGRPVELPAGSAQTTLVRDGRPVAVVAHEPGLLDDDQLAEEVTAAARLALENERLQADVRARLEELRASRARIVESSDTERRRLERDLHDGAQQRLVGLSLSLRLLRSQEPDSTELTAAEDELRLAIAELRELAHGIYPAVLSDEGFAAAVEALGEESRVPIRIGALPEERFATAVETAAYALVAEAAGVASPALAVSARRSDGLLAVEVEASSIDGLDLVVLEDRVGALDGRLAVTTAGSGRGVTIRAELPCGS
jgi:signal transduction histidine kinase